MWIPVKSLWVEPASGATSWSLGAKRHVCSFCVTVRCDNYLAVNGNGAAITSKAKLTRLTLDYCDYCVWLCTWQKEFEFEMWAHNKKICETNRGMWTYIKHTSSCPFSYPYHLKNISSCCHNFFCLQLLLHDIYWIRKCPLANLKINCFISFFLELISISILYYK